MTTDSPENSAEVGIDVQRLVRSVWAAAYRVGAREGSNACASYYHGDSCSQEPTPEKMWDEEVQWQIDSEFQNFNITNPDDWDDL